MPALLAASDLLMIMGSVLCGAIPGGIAMKLSLSRKATVMALLCLVLPIASGTMLQSEGYGPPVWAVVPAMVASLLLNVMLITNYYKVRDLRIKTLLDIQEDDGGPPKKKKKR